MKIGIIPVNVGGPEVAYAADLAVKAEAVGIESAWTFEHVMVPNDYASKYPYARSGKMPVTPETHFVDPLIQLTNIAARTKTLRLGTGVNILPQANPLLLAKQAASLDFLSGGRLLLGLGLGWLREEYEALGVPFERRGARYDDYVAAMKKVWSGESVEHESEFVRLTNFKSYPRPAQKPHPPIIVGGSGARAYRRIVELGDGWFAPSNRADHLAPQLSELRAVAEEHGRDPSTIEITTMWPYPDHGDDTIERYAEMGVSRLVVPLMGLAGRGSLPDALERLADDAIRS